MPTVAQDLILQNEGLKKEGYKTIIEEKFAETKTDRPQFKRLLNKLQASDNFVVTKIGRIARPTKKGVEIIESLFKNQEV